MFLIPVDSVIGFSTAAPTAILTRLFQLWDYSYQQVKEWLFVPLNCWFKDGLLNYTSHHNSLGGDGPAQALLAAGLRYISYVIIKTKY